MKDRNTVKTLSAKHSYIRGGPQIGKEGGEEVLFSRQNAYCEVTNYSKGVKFDL